VIRWLAGISARLRYSLHCGTPLSPRRSSVPPYPPAPRATARRAIPVPARGRGSCPRPLRAFRRARAGLHKSLCSDAGAPHRSSPRSPDPVDACALRGSFASHFALTPASLRRNRVPESRREATVAAEGETRQPEGDATERCVPPVEAGRLVGRLRESRGDFRAGPEPRPGPGRGSDDRSPRRFLGGRAQSLRISIGPSRRPPSKCMCK
jgi:hypothetical protein